MPPQFLKFSLPIIVFTIILFNISSIRAGFQMDEKKIEKGLETFFTYSKIKDPDWCKIACKNKLATLESVFEIFEVSNSDNLKLKPMKCDCKNGKNLYIYTDIYKLHVFQSEDRGKIKHIGELNWGICHVDILRWEDREFIKFSESETTKKTQYKDWDPFKKY